MDDGESITEGTYEYNAGSSGNGTGSRANRFDEGVYTHNQFGRVTYSDSYRYYLDYVPVYLNNELLWFEQEITEYRWFGFQGANRATVSWATSEDIEYEGTDFSQTFNSWNEFYSHVPE